MRLIIILVAFGIKFHISSLLKIIKPFLALSVSSHSVKNFTEIVSDEELSTFIQELFDIENGSFLNFVNVDLQGYHNTSNLKEDRAPKP